MQPEPGTIAATAWSFWVQLNNGHIDEALDLLDDDGVYWVAQAGPRRDRNMAAMRKLFRRIAERFPMQMTLLDAIETGDRVALEVESYVELPTGLYNNRYVFIMTVRRGKIVEVHEYLDTNHADAILIPALKG